jgi:hypothetical protein
MHLSRRRPSPAAGNDPEVATTRALMRCLTLVRTYSRLPGQHLEVGQAYRVSLQVPDLVSYVKRLDDVYFVGVYERAIEVALRRMRRKLSRPI